MNAQTLRKEQVAVARQFVHAPVDHVFTERELAALRPFFSNLDRKVFFIQRMPESVVTSLLAMYSRLKDGRGLRGHWVSNMLPSLLAQFLPECATLLEAEKDDNKRGKIIQKWLKDKNITTLDGFCAYNKEAQKLLTMFVQASGGKDTWQRMANGKRIQQFLQMWLDQYGHNSIARTGHVYIGVEDISILAAKSLEWGRPGCAYIELSTRYVDFSGKNQYPVWWELKLINPVLAAITLQHIEMRVQQYRTLIGENFDGVFPNFLRERWGSIATASGVSGESCDVLGNLLPCTTLTSLGIAVSCESLPELLKHLYLDDTPENDALAELIISECEVAGVGHFVRHLELSAWRRADWSYLTPVSDAEFAILPPLLQTEAVLHHSLSATELYATKTLSQILGEMSALQRSSHDKLPAQFEHLAAVFGRTMSFRGWRDLQRMGFSTHHRSRVTPLVGYYAYPKPAPRELARAFYVARMADQELWYEMLSHNVHPMLRQYPMTMGELVTYQIAGNFRQSEFCDWQRSKWGVNDEVRGEFLFMEQRLRGMYPWWSRLSRADITPHYVFARGDSPVVLP